jgi:proteasome lid subunit RPN8/RPN11
MLETLVEEVYAHAIATAPHECCGLAIIFKGKLKYIPCTNMLSGDAFCIPVEEYAKAEELGEVVGVCHSHVNIPAVPSEADKVACEASQVPWLIVSIPTKEFTILNPEGYKAPLIGRPFYHGVLDCYSIVRDYYKEVLNISIPDFRRDNCWWDLGQNLYLENYEKAGFTKVQDLKEHDVILMALGSTIVNHAAVYIGDNKVLQHCTNRLSSRDVYGGYWQKNTHCVVRHRSLL